MAGFQFEILLWNLATDYTDGQNPVACTRKTSHIG